VPENNALQSKLIIHQQQQIRALQSQVRQLEQDNAELKKVLLITLRDNLGGTPIVINRQRLNETAGEFDLDENFDGDLLVSIRRANT